MQKAYKSEDPHAILGPGNRKNERETVEEKEETAGSQPCKRKRLTEVLKAPTPSPVKTDSCNAFHNRTQDRTKERENCTVLDLGISKDWEWAAKAPGVGLLNTYCAGKRPRTGWSTRLSILKKTLRDATLRLCQRSQLTLPPLNRPTWLTTQSNKTQYKCSEAFGNNSDISKNTHCLPQNANSHRGRGSNCSDLLVKRQPGIENDTVWHPRFSTPQQNHQSPSRGTKAQPYENEK